MVSMNGCLVRNLMKQANLLEFFSFGCNSLVVMNYFGEITGGLPWWGAGWN
jgi:hypothetical protein